MSGAAVVVLLGPGAGGQQVRDLFASQPKCVEHQAEQDGDGEVRADPRLPPGRAWLIIDGEGEGPPTMAPAKPF